MRVRPLDPGHAPDHRLGRLLAPLHPWPDAAMAHAYVVAEPADDQADPLQPRRLGRQLIQRRLQIRLPRPQMHVLGRRFRQPLAPHHRLGRQTELPRTGDQAHPLQPVLHLRFGALRSTEHLKRQLRRPVAIGVQRQVLEHHIGRAAIGGRPPLHRLDQRVGQLVLRPAMQAHGHARHVHRLAVGPDAPHPVDRPLAQSHGETQRVGVVDRLSRLPRRPLLLALQEPRGPDHLSRHPRPAEDAGHRRSLGRRLQLQPLQPRPDLPRRRQSRHKPVVQRPPQQAPGQQAQAADARHPAQPAQQHLRHRLLLQIPAKGSGQRNAATSRRRHHGPIQLSTTERPQ